MKETLKKYSVSYTDDGDPCCPVFTTTVKAFNKERAEMKFYDRAAAEAPEWENGGWKIVSIKLAPNQGAVNGKA